MAVPFERLGPGQVGRLAYQVIGRDGPIFNPSNIQYLPPPDSISEFSTHAEVATALAGVNLVGMIGVAAISAVTLREVRRLQGKVNAVLLGIARLEGYLKDLAMKVERIDMRVAENNLREAIRHVFGRSVHSDQIELKGLADLRNDFDNLFESIEEPVYFNLGVRLATDVRENVEALYALLFSVRLLVAQRHNEAVKGDPGRVVRLLWSDSYLDAFDVASHIAGAIGWNRILKAYDRSVGKVLRDVDSRFTFSDEDDVAHFEKVLKNGLGNSLEAIFGELFQGGVAIWAVLPDEVFAGETRQVYDRLAEVASQWLWNTDSGLLVRTRLELDGLAEGYDKVFWTHLGQDEKVELSCLSVAGALPQEASAAG